MRGGVQRLLDNVLKTLTATSLMSLSGATLTGIVSAVIMFLGARQILAGTMTLGRFFQYIFFLGLLVAPVFQIVAIGTQITEAITGLERTREILNESMEDQDPNRTVAPGPHRRPASNLKMCSFSYEAKQGSAARNFVSVGTGNGDGAGGTVWIGKVDDHWTVVSVLYTDRRAEFWWTEWICPRCC